ncbi:UDP-glucose dehydrogenase family protein [Streptomyces sp. NPDC088768]|uniref:UDP-glucose dehydrogenase family protein n=1 Tax=Streptomyces sp. NPDC088768 TaxID=3365894 RepID=UPI003816D1A5
MKITVVGCGRLGAPYTAALAEAGHHVVGVEVNPEALTELQNGRCPFDEPGVSHYIRENSDAGRLRFTGSFDEAVEHGEVFFLAVPTPQEEHGTMMDVSAVEDSIRQITRRLTRDVVLIGKSTVPVGTAERMAVLATSLAPQGVRVRTGWSPDFLREALSMETTLRPARLVLGTSPADRDGVEAAARQAWRPFLEAGAELLVSDFATADLTKAAANAFLATKMSFANLVDDMCRASGADMDVVSRSMGLDPRIGDFGLTPGLGWGGSCLGKDIRAFADRSQHVGAAATAAFLRTVDEVNSARRALAVEHARAVLGDLKGATVAVWGASFKPGVGDISDSPALDVAGQLHRAGAVVRIYDPSVNALVERHEPDLTVVSTAREAVAGAGLLMVLTDWPEFTDLDPATFAAALPVIDARRCLDAERWQRAGWSHQLLGHFPHADGEHR